jgi:DNA-directed RNA polymerase subunit RPC12/RpoP
MFIDDDATQGRNRGVAARDLLNPEFRASNKAGRGARVTAPALERPGEPVACPSCGDSKWVADYYEVVHQDVRLVSDADGRLRVDDWLGGTETYDNASTDEECYRCLECGEELPADGESNNHPLLLLQRIVEALSGKPWNRETVSVIARILRDGGFEIDPGENGAE